MTVPPRVSYAGSYLHQMDAKNRLTMPAKWRIDGDEGLYLAVPEENIGYIQILPPRMVEQLEQRSSERFSMADEEHQLMLMEMFERSHFFSYDKQGRFALPETMIRNAGLSKEAQFVGMLGTFSIWSPERYVARPKLSKPRSEIIRQIGL